MSEMSEFIVQHGVTTFLHRELVRNDLGLEHDEEAVRMLVRAIVFDYLDKRGIVAKGSTATSVRGRTVRIEVHYDGHVIHVN